MFTDIGLLFAGLRGPFGDHYARMSKPTRKVILAPRRRLKEKFPTHYICEAFRILDADYQHAPQELHDTWNAHATAPGISGYDAYMSQALTATAQGWYPPDLPGEGNGSTPHPLMPGCIIPPPLIAPVNPDAKCLVGQARCDIRLNGYGQVEYRYRHSFRDPRFPNPANVTVVILGLWDEQLQISHLSIVGEVGVNKDTGWVNTHRTPAYLRLTCFAHYKYFLLDQQYNLPLGQAVAVPQNPGADQGDLECHQAPIIDLHGPIPIALGKWDSLYGEISWGIQGYVERLPYRWYRLGFNFKVTARPNYTTPVGTIHLRGFWDKINYKYRLNLRGKLRTIIRENPGPGIWKPPTHFWRIVRVDNPSWIGVKATITWKAHSVSKILRHKHVHTFDTVKDPAWKRP